MVRDSELKITGEDPESVDKAARTVKSLLTLIGSGEALTEQNVRYCMRMVEKTRRKSGPAGGRLHLHHQPGETRQTQNSGAAHLL